MRQRLLRVISTWPFIICLVLLLLNDWILKASYGNALTGKLSDFAGIAVVAMLLHAAFPLHKWHVYVGLSLFFCWWKSPLSNGAIQVFNQLVFFQIARVVDYTDLVALVVLPLCCAIAAKPDRFVVDVVISKKLLLLPLLAATFVGITGTSQIPRHQAYTIQNKTSNDLERNEIANIIKAIALKNGLECSECMSPTDKATYTKTLGQVRLHYVFVHAKAISFEIQASGTGGFFFHTSGEERINLLREPIKKALAERFSDLEYIEALGVRR
jgi:hypothetical protein